MIYYYFGSKEQLYAAALEEMYGGIRDAEARLELDALPPDAAMRRLVETTFDHHAAHPAFVRMVSVENILEARHVRQSPSIRARNAAVIGKLEGLLARGVAAGLFRAGVDPLDLHMLISGFCFYRIANRHTLGAIYGVEMEAPARAAAHKAMIADAVLRWLSPR